jgi:vacuolar-type H+-ATPase subunit H
MAKAKTDFTDYIQAFEDEMASFIKRVENRAKERIQKAIEDAEEVHPKYIPSQICFPRKF